MLDSGRLPPSMRFATGLPPTSGSYSKSGELVVQDEAADHELAAERALHARGHRDGVAGAVDDRKWLVDGRSADAAGA